MAEYGSYGNSGLSLLAYLFGTVLSGSVIYIATVSVEWMLLCVLLIAAYYLGVQLFRKAPFVEFFTSFLLGLTLGCSLVFQLCVSAELKLFLWFVAVVDIFHYSEYLFTCLYRKSEASFSSFLLNHSTTYWLAMSAATLEHAAVSVFFPSIKSWHWIGVLGLATVVVGEVLRKTAMAIAKDNFSHLIEFRKRREHTLITTGLYALCRHPAYLGWFIWSIGTQLILINPVCSVAFAVVSWEFFRQRVVEEETYLVRFFGQAYIDYMRRVGTGIPFVHGLEKYHA